MPELLTYRQEFYRKLVHISSSSIAFFLWYFGKDILLPWLLAITIIFPILDYLRKYSSVLRNIYFVFFKIITRPNEFQGLSGASWVFMGAGATVYLFSENIAIISLLVMSLSDSSAALIGIKFGNTRLFNKTLEGSFSFLITPFLFDI